MARSSSNKHPSRMIGLADFIDGYVVEALGLYTFGASHEVPVFVLAAKQMRDLMGHAIHNAPALGASFLPIAAAFALFDATQVAANQALRGLKDVRVPMGLTFISYWAVGFPITTWLRLGTSLGAVGVWYGLLASLAAAALLLGARLWVMTRG